MGAELKRPSVEGPPIRVIRTGPGCCGMKCGDTYDARGDVGAYVSVHLPDGTWTSPHFAPNFFRADVTSDDRRKDG